jgi:peptidyl-dipeptidase Dcp
MAIRACVAVVTVALLSVLSDSRAAEFNPLIVPSPLPYGAPPFDRIRSADYLPAIELAIADHAADIDRIANDPAPPSFDNTVVAMERSGATLARVTGIFTNVAQANADKVLDATRVAVQPLLQAHEDSISLNAKLFARIKALHAHLDTLELRDHEKFLLDQTYRKFVHAGAALSDSDKARLRALNQEIGKLSTAFQQSLLAATDAGAVHVADRMSLAGLPPDQIEAAARKGDFVLPLRNTTQQPVLDRLTDRALRTRVLDASMARGDGQGPHDLRNTIASIAQLRAQKAQLFGFPNFAAYALDNQMSGSPAAALKLMDSMVPAATAKARGEAADMQAVIDRLGGGFTLGPQDWGFYAEQVRREKYALDDAATRPYFELNRALQDGVFYAAGQLYGVTFKERHDIPVFQPDVRVFEMFDHDGTPLALLYADYFARPNKQGGAWCSDFVPPSGLLGLKPVVANFANFTKPAAGQPALLGFDDVVTIFHEFGHALHTVFSNQRFPSQNGFDMPTDVIEFPSQFNEHWALEPAVLAHYAHHYQTGAPMPADLIAKLRASRNFNQGYKLTEYLAAALLDMEWHALPADAPKQVPDMFEAAALKKHHIDMAAVPPRYRSTYFSHIWSGGYAAKYYAYIWGEVLDDDAYTWFQEHGGMTRANGQIFRNMVLAPGYTADPMALYRAFRGRDPEVGALLKARGLPAG